MNCLFTIPQSDYDKLVLNEQISVVGYMTEPEAGCSYHYKRRKQTCDHRTGMEPYEAIGNEIDNWQLSKAIVFLYQLNETTIDSYY